MKTFMGFLIEVSMKTLTSYKKKAADSASAADEVGDFKRGNKRFSGIIKATKKQFAKDTIGVREDADPLNVPTPTVNTIADKHNVSVEEIESQLKKGIAVEKEHTTHEDVAREIALDHLNENPDYYTKLATVEKS